MKLSKRLTSLTFAIGILVFAPAIPTCSQNVTSAAVSVRKSEDLSRVDIPTLLKLAESGDALAQDWLGYRLYNGAGISQDYGQALIWFRKSAAQGNSGSQTFLGSMYYSGQGVSQDYGQALGWFRKAVDQGNSSGEYSLGILYLNGQGVLRDTALARKFFQLAADQGFQLAKDELTRLDALQPQLQAEEKRLAAQSASERQGTQPVTSGANAVYQGVRAGTNVPHRNPAATKVDVDASDISSLSQKMAQYQREKIPELQARSLPDAKSCRKGKPHGDWDVSQACAYAAMSFSGAAKEQTLLKGCSFENLTGNGPNSCLDLGKFYVSFGRNLEALAAVEARNAPWDLDVTLHDVKLKAYRALGNSEMEKRELQFLCYSLSRSQYCPALRKFGEDVDMDDAVARAHSRDRDENRRRAEQVKFENHMKRIQREGHEEAMAAVSDAINNTVASIQQSQADMAQARVNAAAIRMAQQNKGAGGYPTTSSGGSSSNSSSSSTTTTKPAPKSSTTSTSDSSDSTPSSDSSADSSGSSGTASNSGKPFNPYSSAGSGYNPYSGQGVPAEGSTIPGENGHWIEEEYIVTYVSTSVRHANITLTLVNSAGEMDEHGAFVKFANPDKYHSLYYGFAGVVNEMIEAGSTQARSWSAPYLDANRPNPAFQARVTIRYFAVY